MYFASDNGAGASPKILAAVAEAMSAGSAPSYGGDAWTKRVEQRFCEIFEREVAVFLAASGTATNALALAHLTPPWGAIYGHEVAHTITSECGAPEFYAGAKLVPVSHASAKLAPEAIARKLAEARIGDAHSIQPATITLTNLTECGTLYRSEEVAAIGRLARERGLKLHMDGARFANALVASGATPAEMTWKTGVDVLSLGATKNGAIAAEAVVFFDPALAKDFQYRRMRGGHLLSKMRFVAAQFEAWFADGHWLALAGHANAMAKRLAEGFEARGVRLAWPTEGNEVFAILSEARAARLRAEGVQFHPWPAISLPAGVALAPGEVIGRLICSFETQASDVDALLAFLPE